MNSPAYFRIEGIDKLHFACDRLRASLSVDSCAANWRAGNDANDNRRGACRSCPIGAMHAGETATSLSPLKGTLTCSRCHRGSTRAWLIGKWLCVSCWNRESEWVRGRNAKGKAPVKMLPLAPRSLRIIEAGTARTVYRQLTQSHDELIVGALRDCKGAVTFMANPAMGRQFAQLSLF